MRKTTVTSIRSIARGINGTHRANQMPDLSGFDFVRVHAGLGMIFVNVAQTADCVGHAKRRDAAKARAEYAYRTALDAASSLSEGDFARLQHRLEALRRAIETLAPALVDARLKVQLSSTAAR